ncbi:MAG: nucleotidyltransferase domain-containing protein [Candidatus Methanomethylicaceae archaeon]
MWLPRWLGEVYSKLYLEFGLEPFKFDDAKDLLRSDKSWLNVAFSKLHSTRALYIHARLRPRLYRVIRPESFVLISAGVMKNLSKIKQERYLQLISDITKLLIERYEKLSVCLYGSVARGTARPDSDLDLLVVSDGFEGSISSRLDRLSDLEVMVSDEIDRLKRLGIETGISFYPLRREEVLRTPPILLDLTVDGIILYDEDQFLESILSRLKIRLNELGARRISAEDTLYWDLKPDYRFGEVIEL